MTTIFELRAWHLLEEKMCEISVINLEKGAFLKGVRSGVDQVLAGGRLVIEAPLDGRFCDFAEFELLRYTGKKDRKGTKLFEGDICKKTYGSTTPTFVIAWDENRMTFIQNDGFNTALYEVASEHIEKIGTIYENPELDPTISLK